MMNNHLYQPQIAPNEEHFPLLAQIWTHSPKLHSHVTVFENADNQYIVANAKSQQYFTCSAASFKLLNLLDGKLTVCNIAKQLSIHEDQNQALETLLTKLVNYHMFIGLGDDIEKKAWWYNLRYPISIKFSLFNPQQLLDKIHFIGEIFFSRAFIVTFCALLCLCLTLLPDQWPNIEAHWQSRFFEANNSVLFVLAYVSLKIIHEIGHGLAVTRHGGKVGNCGFFLLVFMPLPFIDTSASYLFYQRTKRFQVALAGMWFEFTLAMLAFIYWSSLSPGALRDFAFNIVFIGSFSTLIFNLNPLMKFDGYYLLSDALGVFNLNEISKTLLKNKIKTLFFGLTANALGSHAKHRALLLIYAMCALPYRVFLGLFIAYFLSQQFFIFGVLLAAWVFCLMLIAPCLNGIKSLYTQALVQQKKMRFFSIVIVLSVFSLYFIFLHTFHFSHSYMTLSVIPKNQQVKAHASGEVKSVRVQNAAAVSKNQPILVLSNPLLEMQFAVIKASLQELKGEYNKVKFTDKTMANSWKEKIRLQQQSINEYIKLTQALTLRAVNDGNIHFTNATDLTGQYLQRGDVIGNIFKQKKLTATTIIPQQDISFIRQHLSDIQIMFNSQPNQTFAASILSIKPAAYSQLPSRFLGSSTGTGIVVDNRDSSGKKTLSPFFIVELLITNPQLNYVPARGVARFDSAKLTINDYVSAKLKYLWLDKISW